MEKEELKRGMVVIAENNVYYQEGEIKGIEESTGTRKGLLYNVGNNWFFGDEVTPTNATATPNEYYDMLRKECDFLIKDISNCLKDVGEVDKKGVHYITFRRECGMPCFHFGSKLVRAKKVYTTDGEVFCIDKETNDKLMINHDLFALWSVFGSIFSKYIKK